MLLFSISALQNISILKILFIISSWNYCRKSRKELSSYLFSLYRRPFCKRPLNALQKAVKRTPFNGYLCCD